MGRPVDEVQARGGRELVSRAKLTRSSLRGQEGLAKNREIEAPAGLVGQGEPCHWLNREEHSRSNRDAGLNQRYGTAADRMLRFEKQQQAAHSRPKFI